MRLHLLVTMKHRRTHIQRPQQQLFRVRSIGSSAKNRNGGSNGGPMLKTQKIRSNILAIRGRLSDVVRGWIMRVGRCATKVRDGIPCGLVEPSSTLHPLWPYRSSNRADRRVAQRRCVAGSSTVRRSKRHPLDLASRRLSPYRSRASPRRKLPSIRELHTFIRYRARRAKRTTIPLRSIAPSATNDPKHCKSPLQKVKIFKSLSSSDDPPAIRLPRTRL
jgi:hypothetical protein